MTYLALFISGATLIASPAAGKMTLSFMVAHGSSRNILDLIFVFYIKG